MMHCLASYLMFCIFFLSSIGGLAPPLPWEIEEDAVQPFKDEVRLIEVPHTANTKTCHRCRGTGKLHRFLFNNT